ncbi:MAG: acyl-CoA dehydrogenase family protein [Mycobacterium sp.]
MTIPIERTDVVDLPEQLRPAIEAGIADGDRLGDIPVALHDTLRESGAFRLLTPRELGGSETPLTTTLSVYEHFGRIDGSVGLLVWNANFGFIGALLNDTGLAHIWKTGTDPVLANSGVPSTAVPVEGGYRVTGQWKIVTGIHRADWLVVVGVVSVDGQPRLTASGAPDVRIFVIPTDQVDIRDTWDVTGMRATGSRDAVGDAIFVPSDLAAPLDAPARIDRPLYRGFLPTLVFAGCSAVTLGVAAHAIDETANLVRAKPAMAGGTVADAGRTQYLIAKAKTSVDAARLLLLSAAGDLQNAAEHNTPVTLDMRAALRAAMTHAADVSRVALTDMYQLAGSSALYRSNPIERLFRDGMAATQHANQSAVFMEAAGRVRLGLDPGLPLF